MPCVNELSPTAEHIFLTAMDLFRSQGYAKTNIRQIAEQSEVSLGLVNHHFGSKRQLGYLVLETLIRYVIGQFDISSEKQNKNMLFYDAAETRAVNCYLSHGPFRLFYLDTLVVDIFFNYLEQNSSFLLEQLQTTYGFTISHDMALLYCRYIPYMVEKTLVLKKAQGLFPGISEEEIPYQIFASTYSGRVPREELLRADAWGREITPQILAKLEPTPSSTVLRTAGLLPASEHRTKAGQRQSTQYCL